jgi:hypothetical protein
MFSDVLHKDKDIRRNFTNMQRKFIDSLKKQTDCSDRYGFLHSTPLIVSQESQKEFKEVYEVLMKAVKRIILNYEKDENIRKILPLSKSSRNLVSYCDFSYDMGTLRPDFLINRDMEFKFNEINARFPFNGYFISYYMNNSLASIGEFQKQEISKLSELDNILFEFDRLKGEVSIIKRKEADWDILFFAENMIRRGKKVNHFYAEDLELKNKNKEKKLFVGDKELDSIVIELTQQELENNFNEDKIRSLKNHSHINDIRTILLGHDKRMLAVLYNDEILSRYLNKQEKDILKPHLIETYSFHSLDNLTDILQSKDRWVLKPALKGKMKDLYIGDKVSEKKWRQAFEKAQKEPFIVQKKIDEHEFDIYLPHLNTCKVALSGLLLGIDGRFISQGVYRGFAQDPTSLWNGCMFIAPALYK